MRDYPTFLDRKIGGELLCALAARSAKGFHEFPWEDELITLRTRSKTSKGPLMVRIRVLYGLSMSSNALVKNGVACWMVAFAN